MSQLQVELCDKRQSILEHSGHLLVLGGPGSGKTTIALLKAKGICPGLSAGQEILFLSFSRAAVRQVLSRCRDILSASERSHLTVQTYHAFCIGMLEAHGHLLHGKSPRFLFPRVEALMRAEHQGKWDIEIPRLASLGTYCFDAVASGVAQLLESSSMVRELYGGKFPVIVVDEFQDTDDDQWRIVKALSIDATIVCLADAEQRIYEFRKGIDVQRIDKATEALKPKCVDLGNENHRSPQAGVLAFANAVLTNQQLPETKDVRSVSYRYANNLPSVIHFEVLRMLHALRKREITAPSVAVLARANTLVSQASEHLSEKRQVTVQGGRRLSLPAIDHAVVWDAELTVAAARVVASILEWSARDGKKSSSLTLRAIGLFYRQKNADRPSKSATNDAKSYENAAAGVQSDKKPRSNVAKALLDAREARVEFTGDPSADWLTARFVLHSVGASEIYAAAKMMRLFRARDEVGGALASLWTEKANYAGAEQLVEAALDRQMLMSTERDARGCVLMSMHKSKGKEFDGVILVEGTYSSSFFDNGEKPPFIQSRRLLRVGITRARSMVTLIRPDGAQPLVD